jgi:hypothetical protein
MTISELWTALKIGKEIRNPATWKNRQLATNAVAGILAVTFGALPAMGVNVNISPTDQVMYGGQIVSLLGLANVILTAITSKKVGLPALK